MIRRRTTPAQEAMNQHWVRYLRQIQSDNVSGAAAVSIVLLAVSLLILVGIGYLGRRAARDADEE